MRALWKLTLIQAKLYLREPIGAFFTLLFAPLMLILFGFIYGNDPMPMLGGRGSMDVSVPAYTGMIIGSVGLMSVPIGTAARRETGVLRRFRATPLRPIVYLIADVLVYFVTIGYFLAGLAPTARVAQVVGMVIFYPMMFLSGSAIPLEAMPEGIRNVSRFIPLTHVVALLKGLWFGDGWGEHLTEVGILIGLLVIGMVVSARTFRWE